ncbi:MAG: hypothetical protein ACFFBH_06630 [Promethearchaeota archaeon]
MKSAIKGPDCTNPNNCRGGCCSIKIDVPKVLAEEYIRRKYATKEDFNRGNVFTFELRFDNKIGKCFLFDSKLNGCKVHHSGIKPPQCWLYPFYDFPNSKGLIDCKKVSGWEIIDHDKTLEAEKLLDKYNFLCLLEAKSEMKKIKYRLGLNFSPKNCNNTMVLKNSIMRIAPSSLAGFIDKWDNFDVLLADGLSLQMKKFCLEYNSACPLLPNDFFKCKNVCSKITNHLILFLKQHLINFIKRNGLDVYGEYPLHKLFNHVIV